jgi:hypothetical protein
MTWGINHNKQIDEANSPTTAWLLVLGLQI